MSLQGHVSVTFRDRPWNLSHPKHVGRSNGLMVLASVEAKPSNKIANETRPGRYGRTVLFPLFRGSSLALMTSEMFVRLIFGVVDGEGRRGERRGRRT